MNEFIDPTSLEGQIAELRRQIAAIDVQIRAKCSGRAQGAIAPGKINPYIQRIRNKRERLVARLVELGGSEERE
jgi:hypothetical protein